MERQGERKRGGGRVKEGCNSIQLTRCANIPDALLTIFSLVITAPLGRPVVPLV